MIISRNSRNNDAWHATNTFGEQQSTLVSFFFPYIFVTLFTSKHKHIRVYTNKIVTWNATLFDSARKWTRQCTSKTRKKRREEGEQTREEEKTRKRCCQRWRQRLRNIITVLISTEEEEEAAPLPAACTRKRSSRTRFYFSAITSS